MKKKSLKSLSFILMGIIFTSIMGLFVYNNSVGSVQATEVTLETETESKENLRSMVYGNPDTATKGLIFYPGANVDFKQYDTLLKGIAADNNILCISVEMPLDIAILDVTAAGRYMISCKYKNIKEWYIGGHSLGGAMAATYASIQTSDLDIKNDIKGVILLAAYSPLSLKYESHKNIFTQKEVVDRDVKVLNITATNDGVLNQESYEKYRKNLPDNTTDVVIQGGNHAQFGNYGAQEGDNPATISPEEQIRQTVQAIKNFI